MTPEGSHVYSIFAVGPSWDIRGYHGILEKLCRQGQNGHKRHVNPKGSVMKSVIFVLYQKGIAAPTSLKKNKVI
jgi:hypothetical protein